MKACWALLLACAGAVWAQPDPALMRKLFDENLAQAQRQFGDGDARTAQAARDRAMFLDRAGDKAAARLAFRETLRLDDRALGEKAPQTLEDAGALAAMLPAAQAAPFLARASESSDPTVAGPALSALAAMRRAAGDRADAAALLRRAVTQAELADGKNGPIVALVLKALAAVAPAEESIACWRRALDIDRASSGPRGEATVEDARALSAALRRAGHAADAAAVEREFGFAPSR